MTVQSTTVRHLLTSTGTSRLWAYTFRVINTSSVKLWVETAPDVWEVVPTEEYEVTMNSNGVGGDVTYPLAPVPILAAGVRVLIVRETNRQQLVEINNTTTYRPEVLSQMIDKLAVITQDLAFKIDRTLQLGPHASGLSYSQMVSGELVKFDGTKFVAGGTFEGLEDLEAAAAASAAAAAASATNASAQVTLAANQVALAAAQVGLAAAQVDLAADYANDAATILTQVQAIQTAVETLTGDIIGAVVIPCNCVFASELGTGTLVLEPMIEHPPLAAGMVFRFRAPAGVNGYSPLIRFGTAPFGAGPFYNLRNKLGVAVPTAYVRSDVDTFITYDGVEFRAGREIERGSNANGSFVKFEDGTMICQSPEFTHDATTASGSVFTSGSQTWTYPFPFLTGGIVSAGGSTNDVRCWIPGNSGGSTNFLYAIMSSVSVASRVARLFAHGRWY